MGRCTAPDCSRQARYAPAGEKPQRCKVHIEEGDVNLVDRLCQHPGCTTQARFGQGTKPQHCAKHKLDGDKLTYERKCYCCDREIAYKSPYSREPSSCSLHKEAWYIPLRNYFCTYCNKSATFGTEKGRALRCLKHKLEGDTNVTAKKCSGQDCVKQPSYGPFGGTCQTCLAHKLPEYVYLKRKQCDIYKCREKATQGRLCSAHALERDLNKRNKTITV